MQKIKLKNGTEISNIQSIFGYVESIGENDRRETLVIKLVDSTVEAVRTAMFTDTTVLDTIEIYGVTEDGDVLQGVHERYNLPCSITQDLTNNLIEVKVARKSNLEQQLINTQLALVELASLLEV